MGWLWQLLVGAALFVFPGYAAISIFKLREDFGPVEELCMALGLSIGIIPLALYVSTLFGIALTPTRAGVLLLAAALVASWRLRRRWLDWRGSQIKKPSAITIALGLVFAGSLLARLLAVKGIDFPLWTDSYHHTLIAQLISDTGMVPSSYEPYAPIHSFTYHFGFHAIVAWFHWLTGVPVPRSVVLIGQAINALVVPTTYLLGWRLFRDRNAGLVSALFLGLLSHMPAYYVNWGRYTQLSGQILLPVVVVLTIEALEAREAPFRTRILAGIGVAGLFLVHSRITLFYGVFVALLLLFRLASGWRDRCQRKSLLMAVIIVALTATLIDAPWIWRFFSTFGANVARQTLGGFQRQDSGDYFNWSIREFVDYGVRLDLWLLAGLGACWGLIRNDKNVGLLIIWSLLLFGAANVHLIGLSPFFSTLIVIIWIYLPAALLIGYLSGQVLQLASAVNTRWFHSRPVLQFAILVVFLPLAAEGVPYIRDLTLPENGFVRPADLEAMEWIKEHAPADALFYIKAHFWTPGVAHGLDGGYWIPYLTGRETIIPPQVYASDGSPEYASFINRRIRALMEAGTPDQLWQVMKEYHITHIYIGSRPTDLLPEPFLEDPAHFGLVYNDDAVWIFQVADP